MQYFIEEPFHVTSGRDYDGTFSDYRRAEQDVSDLRERGNSRSARQPANLDHPLVDHVQLYTVQDAPNVTIDNDAHDNMTRIDILAANRTGSLLQVGCMQ